MTYCTNCKTAASRLDRFCRHCGAPIRPTSVRAGLLQPIFLAIGGRADIRKRVVVAVSVVAVICVAVTMLRTLPTGSVPLLPSFSLEEYYVMIVLALLIGAFGLFFPVGKEGSRRRDPGAVSTEEKVSESRTPPHESETDPSRNFHNEPAPQRSISVGDQDRVVAVTAKSPKSVLETPRTTQPEKDTDNSFPKQDPDYGKPVNDRDVGDFDILGRTVRVPLQTEAITSPAEQLRTNEPPRQIETNETVAFNGGRGEEGNTVRTLLRRMQQIERERDQLKEKLWTARGRPSRLLPAVMLAFGAISLASAVLYTETILAFIGLGLTFWGGLLIQIRPEKYVRAELVGSTGLSSIMTLDRLLNSLGFTGRGIYLPAAKLQETRVFVPADNGAALPPILQVRGALVDSPKGAAIMPPGLSLAMLVESELGTDVTKYDLGHLEGRLAKVITEDLEIAKDFEMIVTDGHIRLKLNDPIYSDMSLDLKEATRIFGLLGCPICSALACIVAASTKKKILFEGESLSAGRIMEASYRILENS